MNNSNQRFWLKLFIAIIAAALIKIFSLFGGLVEVGYSTGIYPVVSTVLRAVTGWLPVSLGDILYGAAFVWLIVRFVKLVMLIVRRKATWHGFWQGVGKTVIKMLWVYVVFNALWGLNYDRYGISYQLNLNPAKYSDSELKHITALLVEKVNAGHSALGDSTFVFPTDKRVFLFAAAAYDSAAVEYPFLKYRCTSVKSSLYGRMDNYFGFLGYYNPFTSEAQVNTAVPPFIIPYTACHEIAHQVGYASESEANFVGYLVAKASKNSVLQYSAYADLFSYANSELYMRDTAAARSNFRALDTLVKQDFRRYRKFILDHKNPLEPLVRRSYSQYLKANKQPKGIDTYDEVVAWLIGYEKKFGKI